MSSILNKGANKSAPKKKPGKTFSGNKTWFVFAIIAGIAAAGIIFAILSNLVSTTTYYVLNRDVPARSQITPDMLTEVVTSNGSQPRNALGLDEVTFEEVYATYSLNTGDIITASNTGELIPLQQGIPEDYVVASFVADANNAVAGKLATGNYIDIIAVNDSDPAVAKYALRHVLLMDVSTDPSSIGASSTVAVDESGEISEEGAPVSSQDQLRTGIPSLYTVALPAADAATLALIRDANLLVVLSPASSEDDFQPGNISKNKADIFGDSEVGDSGAGTDPTFGQGTPEGEVATEEEAPAEEAPAEEAPASEAPADEAPAEEAPAEEVVEGEVPVEEPTQ